MSELELSAYRGVQVRPVAGRIGAEVIGLRLGGDLKEDLIDAIRRTLYRFKVLFFREQALEEAQQEAFGSRFGSLVPHPTIPSVGGTEYVLDVDGAKGARASLWHTDVTFVDAYPQISILRALVVPPCGGDTVWANTAAAYQSLSPHLRELADKLWAVHTNKSDYGSSFPTRTAEGLKRYHEVFQSTVYETHHPIVRVHPGTGEHTLVLGHFAQKILGVPAANSAHL
jgi:taurine dioxygenase